ncbi:hypothetical protein HYV57_01820 [Candidatus Peregrinibacteria bacterium]|nr:hypothetical protein [Candidatus Peregrinibacteria bacterium]
MKKSTYRWEAGARRSDTRLDQKGRKFAKNAIGYAFFNAHFRLFLKTTEPPPPSICFQKNLRMIRYVFISLEFQWKMGHTVAILIFQSCFKRRVCKMD